MDSIFGNSMSLTQKSLDYLWAKQNVSLNNIANNDTPGFKAQYVTFEDRLKKSLTASNKNGKASAASLKKGIDRSGHRVHNTNDVARLDGNNVQLEVENTELVRTYLQYQYQVQSINSDISRLRTAIKG